MNTRLIPGTGRSLGNILHKLHLLTRSLLMRWEGERIIRQRYAAKFGKKLDLSDPQTFSQKLFHQMIAVHRHGNAKFTELADKYLARDYVRSKVGEKYLVRLLWHGTDASGIPFDALPPKCVVKTNHGSGGNIVLSEGYDRVEVVQKLKMWLGENYYWGNREYHYFKIPRRVLVEEFIDDGAADGPLDYRFWCINGRPEFIQVDNHSHTINPFYDITWAKLSLSYREQFDDCDIEKPENFEEMIAVAVQLSSEFDFVRVDLYNVAGRIYFGELTFTPRAGNFKFKPEHWDALLGAKWKMSHLP